MLPEHMAFIQRRLFFVGTAPMSKDGHVNLSPKGYDTFRILSDRKVAYLDLTGSGNETSSHLEENGRITMMFCAFQGPPNILRLYGTGTVILPEDNEWGDYTECSSRAWSPADHYGRYTQSPDVLRLCGSIHVVRERARDAPAVGGAKGEEGLHSYWQVKNLATSTDCRRLLGNV